LHNSCYIFDCYNDRAEHGPSVSKIIKYPSDETHNNSSTPRSKQVSLSFQARWSGDKYILKTTNTNALPIKPPIWLNYSVIGCEDKIATQNEFRFIQYALNREGYDVGAIDGNYGTKTKSALENFQRDNKMKVDGKLSPALADKLAVKIAAFDEGFQNKLSGFIDGGLSIPQYATRDVVFNNLRTAMPQGECVTADLVGSVYPNKKQ
jgi:hypothetical protein